MRQLVFGNPVRDRRISRARRWWLLTLVVEAVRESPRGRAVRGFGRRQKDDLIRDTIVGCVLAALAFGLAVVWDGRVADRQEMFENTRFLRQVSMQENQRKPFTSMYLRDASLAGLTLGCDYRPDPSMSESPSDSQELQKDPRLEAGCAYFWFADLRKADLIGADLRGAFMGGMDFRNARLASAQMQYIYASSTDFCDANLARADLSNAELTGVKFSGATITGTQFDGARLSNVDLSGVNKWSQSGRMNFSGAELYRVDLRGVELTGAQGLQTATVDRICYDRWTRWPPGFKPPMSDCNWKSWWR